MSIKKSRKQQQQFLNPILLNAKHCCNFSTRDNAIYFIFRTNIRIRTKPFFHREKDWFWWSFVTKTLFSREFTIISLRTVIFWTTSRDFVPDKHINRFQEICCRFSNHGPLVFFTRRQVGLNPLLVNLFFFYLKVPSRRGSCRPINCRDPF